MSNPPPAAAKDGYTQLPLAEDGASNVPVSAVSRLYRHALESIFVFLPLADLSRVLAVSRGWSSLVRHMPSTGACLERLDHLVSVVVASSLVRHIAQLGSTSYRPTLSWRTLEIIAKSLSGLIALHCRLFLPQPESITFSNKLRTLDLEVTQLNVDPTFALLNKIIIKISALAELRSLRLGVPRFATTLNLSSLSALSKLSKFTLSTESHDPPPDALLDQIRDSLPHLRHLGIANMKREQFVHLLRGPHQLQWEELQEFCDVDDALAAALSTVRSLTFTEAFRCTSVAFLSLLTRLRTLDLRVLRLPAWAVSADAVVAGLACCAEITELTLSAPVDSSQMQKLLPSLPLLRTMVLARCSELESLGFLSACPSAQRSLRKFSIRSCQHLSLALVELPLPGLTSLTISDSFGMDAAAITRYTPPSVVLPSLMHFVYLARLDQS